MPPQITTNSPIVRPDFNRERGEALVRVLYPSACDVRSPAAYDEIFPPRKLPAGAVVSRYAPSPTGFMHLGGIFVSLINVCLSKQTGGTFILRIEDTDTLRSVPGAVDTIVSALDRFGLAPEEGVLRGANGEITQRGAYGAYVQTERAVIYRDYAISLLLRGLAYPCFLTAEEIDEIRTRQTSLGVTSGIYGHWSKWRDAALSDVETRLRRGDGFVIRLRAPNGTEERVEWDDCVKGMMSMPSNDTDVVLLKSNGIPTYHFAHAIDDHLMRVTHVIRGDEWVSSMPLHVQLFQTLGFPLVRYAHVPPIQKIETKEERDESTGRLRTTESRRKLSKRKDPEADVEFYHELGIPVEAILEYLLNIANSAFEDWRKANPDLPYLEFPFRLEKLSGSGALSDMTKLRSISREMISRMTAEAVYASGLAWARTFDPGLADLMTRSPEYTQRALGIERGTIKVAKRIVVWRDLREQLAYFYDELYSQMETFDFDPAMSVDDRKAILSQVAASYEEADSRDVWFEKIRAIGQKLGFAAEVKQFKAAPTSFKGHVGDVVTPLRVAVCGSRQSADLYEVLRILGAERVRSRIARFL